MYRITRDVHYSRAVLESVLLVYNGPDNFYLFEARFRLDNGQIFLDKVPLYSPLFKTMCTLFTGHKLRHFKKPDSSEFLKHFINKPCVVKLEIVDFLNEPILSYKKVKRVYEPNSSIILT